MRPSEEWVTAAFDRLDQTTWGQLKKRFLEALKRDEEPYEIDGYPTSTEGGGRGGAELTSVEAAADARIQARQDRDELHEDVVKAGEWLSEILRHLDAMRNRLDHIDERSTPSKPAAHSEAVCAEEYCEDPAVNGRDGRCYACYMWRYKWAARHGMPRNLAPIIPQSTILERLAERDRKRVHVSGPLAR